MKKLDMDLAIALAEAKAAYFSDIKSSPNKIKEIFSVEAEALCIIGIWAIAFCCLLSVFIHYLLSGVLDPWMGSAPRVPDSGHGAPTDPLDPFALRRNSSDGGSGADGGGGSSYELMDAPAAKAYLARLAAVGRYQKDVY